MFLPADEKLRHRNSSVTLTDDGFGCSYFFAQVLRDEINHVQVRNVRTITIVLLLVKS